MNLNSFEAYPGVIDLINKGIKSSLFDENYKILNSLGYASDEPIIDFVFENSINPEEGKTIIKLLCDPQTCGPLLISCNQRFKLDKKAQWKLYPISNQRFKIIRNNFR